MNKELKIKGKIAVPILFFLAILIAVAGIKSFVKSQNTKNSTIDKPESTTIFEEKTNDGGDVVIAARPISGLGGTNPEGDIVFDFSIDTHSVDIGDFDVFANIKLVSGDVSQPPKDWQEEAGSIHHKSGKLVFRHFSKLDGDLELLVTNLAGTEERRIKWEV